MSSRSTVQPKQHWLTRCVRMPIRISHWWLNGMVRSWVTFFFSPVRIESDSSSWTALGLAPMGVIPDFQNRGIGSELVREGLKAALELQEKVVVVLGHPRFYPRFGFVPAKSKGLTCEYPVPEDVFMVVELEDGALGGRAGLVKYSSEFNEVE